MGEAAFAPLVSQVNEQHEQLGNSNDNPLPPLLLDNNTYTPTPSAQQHFYEREQANRTPSAPQGFGTIAHVIAIASALNGNFGPAFTISEANRKAEAYQYIKPHVLRANTLTNKGDYAGAQKILNELLTQVGDKSPELSTFIQGAIDKVDKKDVTHQNLRTANVTMEQLINTGVFKDNPKDDPRYPMLTIMKELEKNHSPLSDDLRKAYGESLKLDITTTRDTTRTVNPYSGRVQVTPTQRIVEGDDIPKDAISRIIGRNPGMQAANVITALQGTPTPFRLENGTVIDLSKPPFIDALRAETSKESGFQAKLERAKVLNLPPEVTAQLLIEGGDPDAIASREGLGRPTGGQGGRSIGQLALDAVARQREELAKAGPRATVQENPLAGIQAGVEPSYVDKSNLDTYLEQPQYRLTQEEVKKQRGLRELTSEQRKSSIELMNAYKALALADEMYKHLDNPGDLLSRLSTGLSRLAGDYTGYYDAGTSAAVVQQELISRALEAMEKTDARPDPYVGRMKAVIIGGFADTKQGKRAVRDAVNRIRERLAVHVGRDNVPSLEAVTGHILKGQQDTPQQQSRATPPKEITVYDAQGNPIKAYYDGLANQSESASQPTYPTERQKAGAGLVPGIPSGPTQQPSQQQPTQRPYEQRGYKPRQ